MGLALATQQPLFMLVLGGEPVVTFGGHHALPHAMLLFLQARIPSALHHDACWAPCTSLSKWIPDSRIYLASVAFSSLSQTCHNIIRWNPSRFLHTL